MKINLQKAIIIFIVLLSFAASAYFYNQLPNTIASHWNAQGEVNGYMGKFWGLFLMPFILLAMLAFYIIVPLIDPLKRNIEGFKKHYDLFFIVLFLFMFFIHIWTILWNLGIKIGANIAFPAAMGIFFIFIGYLTGKMKRNWFIGIRTPWTMSSDAVWDKTHKLGSKLFIAAGVISIFGSFTPKYSFIIMITSIIASAIISVIYSYIAFRQESAR